MHIYTYVYTHRYVHNDNIDDGATGTKRGLRATLEYLRVKGHNVDDMWGQITHVCGSVSEAFAGKRGLSECIHACMYVCMYVCG